MAQLVKQNGSVSKRNAPRALRIASAVRAMRVSASQLKEENKAVAQKD
ncbi:hypothetical protein [Thaumasiovibrio subtropicus]|nr:hypothetical protein [Thaumasiovibrio subtropicus]